MSLRGRGGGRKEGKNAKVSSSSLLFLPPSRSTYPTRREDNDAHLGYESSLLRLGPLGLYRSESLDVRELVEEEGVLSELGLVEDSEGEGSVVGRREKEEEESVAG